MEGISFVLSLREQVSGPAKKASDSVRGIGAASEKTKKALDFSAELKKTEDALKKLKADPKGFKELMEAQKKLADERKKLGKEPFFKELGSEIGKHFSFGKLLGAEVLADLMVEGAKKAVEVFAEGVKKAFEEASKSENLRLGAKLSLGAQGGKEFNEDVSRFSKKTGLDDDAIKAMLLPLRRAGFDQKAARTAFAMAGDITAGMGKGGDQAAMSGILDTLTDIKLKGGVGEKKLVGMGVNVPDFKKALAKKLGVGSDEAMKRAEAGKVDPQLLINTIGDAIEARQGGKLGTGTEAFGKTLGARFSKLTNLPNEYLKTISESAGWQKLADSVGGVLEKLDPEGPLGKKIIGGLMSAFDKLSTKVAGMLTEENIDAFIDTLMMIPPIIDGIITVSEVLATIWVGSKIVSGLTAVAGLLPMIGTGAGVAVAAVTAITAPMLAAAAAIAGVGAAIYEVVTHWKELKEAWADGDKTWERFKGFATFQSANPDLDTAKPLTKDMMRSTTIAPNINVTVAAGDDAEHTGQKVAQAAGRHITQHLEAEAQRTGAM